MFVSIATCCLRATRSDTYRMLNFHKVFMKRISDVLDTWDEDNTIIGECFSDLVLDDIANTDNLYLSRSTRSPSYISTMCRITKASPSC